MRNFINVVHDFVFESRGLGARRPGEEFVSNSNPEDKIYVDRVTFFPIGKTEYSSYEEMVEELRSLVTSYKGDINLIKKFMPSDRAFGIAEFVRADGQQKLAWVKPYTTIKLDPTQNDWNNQTGIPGYRYNSRAAAKTQAGLTPQDILTEQSNLTKQDIVNQIAAKFGTTSSLTKLAQAVASGQKFPITLDAPADVGFTAFRDYFCELLHPIALQTGQYKGNAGDAAARFLGKGGFATCSINFGADKTEGLSDSILIGPDGRKIKVSSKGAQGAEASARNLLDSIDELKNSNPQLAKKHEKIVRLIDKVVKGGQAGAPLLLGEDYNIIDSDDAAKIKSFKNMAPINLDNLKSLNLSARLSKLIKERSTKNTESVNLYFHSMAAVAHKVAEHINDSTNFSEAASEILNNAALVQVYTSATESGNKWTLTQFDTKWPSNTTTGVKFSASKTYYSTDIKGNFTFKILRNGAVDNNDETDQLVDTTAKTKPKVDSTPVDLRPTAVKLKDKPTDVGREKR